MMSFNILKLKGPIMTIAPQTQGTRIGDFLIGFGTGAAVGTVAGLVIGDNYAAAAHRQLARPQIRIVINISKYDAAKQSYADFVNNGGERNWRFTSDELRIDSRHRSVLAYAQSGARSLAASHANDLNTMIDAYCDAVAHHIRKHTRSVDPVQLAYDQLIVDTDLRLQ